MAKIQIKSEKLTPFGEIFSGRGAMSNSCCLEPLIECTLEVKLSESFGIVLH